jgi:hypothetical protein
MGVRLEFPQFRPCILIRDATHYFERVKFQPDTHFTLVEIRRSMDE